MNQDLAADVLTVLAKIAPEVVPGGVDHRAPLAEQLDLDSMDVQRFLAALGARFGIDIPEAVVPDLATVEQIVAYLEVHGRHGHHE